MSDLITEVIIEQPRLREAIKNVFLLDVVQKGP